MLTHEDNEVLTRVGPGTPAGELFRRYWMPACLSSEIAEPDGPPVRVRLLGESLVAFRDSNGAVGLVEERCPHRGASLYFGRNEECGLRCVYHGWKFDVSGQCVDQRSERRSFAERIRTTSYPTHESGGIVWTYLGPADTMTAFRDFGTDALPRGEWVANKEYVECNWAQSLDGDLDTAHISNLHMFDAVGEMDDDGTDRPGYPSNYNSMRFWRHDPKPLIEVQDEWYGFRYAGIRQTPNGHRHARVTAYVFPFTTMIGFVPFTTTQIFVAPCDDTSAWRYMFATKPASQQSELGGPPFFTVAGYPFEMNPLNGVVPREYRAENDYGIDRVAQKGESYSGIRHFRSQDFMATESAGPIYDRTREHLGSGDLAVARFHQLVIAAARGLAEGAEPPALGGRGDFGAIRGAEKILDEEEDWRPLGTDGDPVVVEALSRGREAALSGADD